MDERYQIMRRIGNGRHGNVYLAACPRRWKQVALMVPNDPELARRIVREAAILREQGENPFVVSVVDADLDHDPPYVVYEHCRDGTLETSVAQERPWHDVVDDLLDTVRGLRAIHAIQRFPGDVQPGHLLVGRDHRTGQRIVKVASFGLAPVSSMASEPMTWSPAGTDGYMAPEVLAGGSYSAAADMYSLGVIATELLTGTRDPVALAERTNCPIELRKLIQRMLSSEPVLRPDARWTEEKLREIRPTGMLRAC